MSGTKTHLEAAAEFLERTGWKIQADFDRGVVHVPVQGESGAWRAILRAAGGQQLAFYSLADEKAPYDLRTQTAEYLMRANFGLPFGNFEMDFEGGEVRFKTSAAIPVSGPDDFVLRALIYVNVVTMDKYLPGLRQVVSGKATPGQAMRETETSG